MATKRYEVEHQTIVRAPAELAYRLIADVENWSWLFPTTVHAQRLGGDDLGDRVGIWTTTDGNVNHWVALRRMDPRALTVAYRQEWSVAPVADMGGAWVFEPRGERECRVRLLHDYRAIDDDPDTLGWIAEVLDRLSTDELAAFRAGAELVAEDERRVLTFTDEITTHGAVARVYGFLRELPLWVGRVSDLMDVQVLRDADEVQWLRTTMAAGPDTYRSELMRVCLPPDKIGYRYLVVPPLARARTGLWRVCPEAGGARVSLRQTVVFDEPGIEAMLGPGAGLEQARDFARRELGGDAAQILAAVQAYAKEGS
ncbi:MAG TPA: SRPBCC family protein [Micromonosporaceae bacterium]